jgi:hypothetical protein
MDGAIKPANPSILILGDDLPGKKFGPPAKLKISIDSGA